jgi:hypothetical protein
MMETLNLVVGLAVVMLLVSFAVTLITQAIVALLNLRGYALRLKVTNLLVLIDNGIHPYDAAQIAGLLLRNALIGRPGLPWLIPIPDPPSPKHPHTRRKIRLLFKFGLRPASVVHREELTRLLLAFGKEPREYPDTWRWMWRSLDTDDLQTKVRKSLDANGVKSPEKALENIRRKTQELEHTKPDLSNSERNNQAIIEFAKSDFVGKLNGWFDQTIDRASDLFTGWTQAIAFVVALVVAVALQLDALSLVNRLSADKASQGKLVDWAVQHVDTTGPKPAAKLGSHVFSAAQTALSSADLIPLADPDQWWKRWSAAVPCPSASTDPAERPKGCTLPKVSLLGVALSTILLSLGGPFWYSALSGLLKLRSTLADKDDDQRTDRQTNTTPKPAAG